MSNKWGTCQKELRRLAEIHEVAVDDKWRSLKLIDEVLRAMKCDEKRIANIVGPLRELNTLRRKISGHASGEEAKKIRDKVLKEHKSFPSHFYDLCARCDRAARSLQEIFSTKSDE